MKKFIYIVLILAIVAVGIWYFKGGSVESAQMRYAKELCMDEHVVSVEISGEIIKTVSSLPGGGSIYFRPDGSSFICLPAAEPEDITAECVVMAETLDWQKVCGE